MVHYKLIYYDIRGLGEPIRRLFKLAGIEFEDYRIPKNETTYPKLPPEIKSTLPWGSLPVLEVDGKQIAQSLAIGRFLANRFTLAGSDEFEKAKCDEILDSLHDFGSEWKLPMQLEAGDTKHVELLKKILETIVPFYLGKFEEILTTNEAGGSNWLVGKSITWADLEVTNYLQLIMDHSKLPLLKGYPRLQKLISTVESLPEFSKSETGTPVFYDSTKSLSP